MASSTSPLPNLKWATTSHRTANLSTTTTKSPPPLTSDIENSIPREETSHDSIHSTTKVPENPKVLDPSSTPPNSKPNTMLRFRLKINRSQDSEETTPETQTPVSVIGTQTEEQEARNTWNLRPRKRVCFVEPPALFESPCSGFSSGASKKEKKKKEQKKQSFSISLTKEEIEADIMAMTGRKPTKKPKKRPKTVQKGLDKVFPGLCLSSITPQSYLVHERRS